MPKDIMPTCKTANPVPCEWNPNALFIRQLAALIPGIMGTFHADTGRFGDEPWICNDQESMFPLAVAWSWQDDDNPYYHSDELLKTIVKAGDALIDDMDEKGMWIFRKKDNSTWGMIHMPWTYSRWIRSYMLTRGAMSDAERARWDKALKLGFSYINGDCKTIASINNISCHHAMALYAAGKLFGEEEWMKTAAEYIGKVVAAQDPEGFWSEHYGPVVTYNYFYIEALGCYYSMSGDVSVLPALERSARFHFSILFRDGSSAACLDERNNYSRAIAIGYSKAIGVGTTGFAWTAVGRGFLAQQFKLCANTPFSADYLAAMLLHGCSGEAVPPSELGEDGLYISGDGKFCKLSRGPWQVFFSSYACQASPSRWIMERQNMLDIFLDGRGLVCGGGNTRLQPLLSTFTFGDTSLLKMDHVSEKPVLVPEIPLKWHPDRAEIRREGRLATLSMEYGGGRVSVQAVPDEAAGRLAVTFSLLSGVDSDCEAHLPIMQVPGRGHVTLADGSRRELGGALELTGREAGNRFAYGGVLYEVPDEAVLKWPVKLFNQYAKNGASSPDTDRLSLCLPLGRTPGSATVAISATAK